MLPHSQHRECDAWYNGTLETVAELRCFVYRVIAALVINVRTCVLVFMSVYVFVFMRDHKEEDHLALGPYLSLSVFRFLFLFLLFVSAFASHPFCCIVCGWRAVGDRGHQSARDRL